uniref:40S ribosomal protein S21 n=1 Tax=Albugo laibachii Nc14 TaxID=890382 RepID=F0WM79_9STRA|nr:40S ribosomal protein S21 putative [Albugo laibachii Nc14]|eukprot:CCA22407.1 40S ribosomal protein S21 putative [Albugo laibachii Nc14]
MQNEAGQNIDIYIPRKCSWTNRIIAAKDQSSVQISIGRVNEHGLFTGESDTFALAGYIRGKGESDMALTELARQAGLKCAN